MHVQMPMPQIEDMHSTLRGCTVFSVLDVKQAYHQIPIAKKTEGDLTINTHIGLLTFKRLPKAVSRHGDILAAGIDHLRTLCLVLGTDF